MKRRKKRFFFLSNNKHWVFSRAQTISLWCRVCLQRVCVLKYNALYYVRAYNVCWYDINLLLTWRFWLATSSGTSHTSAIPLSTVLLLRRWSPLLMSSEFSDGPAEDGREPLEPLLPLWLLLYKNKLELGLWESKVSSHDSVVP